MATNLGDIDVVDTHRGVDPVTGAATASAIATGLQVTKKVADEAVVGSLVKDLREAEGEALAGTAVDPVTQAGVAEERPIGDYPPELEDEARGTYDNIQRLLDAADQAKNSSHKTAAVNEMQRALASAKNKYPWMANELDTTYGHYVYQNRGLTHLDMVDAATLAESTANAARAEKDIEDIKHRAQHVLFMDPGEHKFGDVAFTNTYVRLSKKETARQAHVQKVAQKQAEATATSVDMLPLWQTHLYKEEGTVARFYDSVMPDLRAYEVERQRLGRSMDTAAMTDFEYQWGEYVKVLERKMVDVKLTLNREFSQPGWFGGARSNDVYGQQARADTDQVIEDLDIFMSMIKGGVADVSEIIKTQGAIRSQQRLDKAPNARVMLEMFAQPGADNLMSLWTSMDNTYQSKEYQDMLSRVLSVEIPSMVTMQMTQHAERDDSLDEFGLAKARDQKRTTGVAPTGGPIVTERGDVISAANLQWKTHLDNAEDPVPLTDWAMANSLNDMAGQLEVFDIYKLENPDIIGDVWTALASDNFNNILQEAGGPNTAAVRDITAVIHDRYLKEGYGPDSLAAHMTEIYKGAHTTAIPATLDSKAIDLLPLLEVNLDKLDEKGAVSFTLNTEKVKEMWPTTASITDRSLLVTGLRNVASVYGIETDSMETLADKIDTLVAPVTGSLAQSDAERRILELQKIAAELSKNTTDYIRVTSHINLSQQPNGEPDYRWAAEKAGLQAILGEHLAVEAD